MGRDRQHPGLGVERVGERTCRRRPGRRDAAVLAGPDLNDAIISLDKPDPYGYAQATTFGVTGDAYWLADRADAIQDDYTPIWPYGWHYTNVPIDSDVRILVDLWDEDLENDDPIGAAEINSTDL